MKTAQKGEVKFHVMSLEEPVEANAEGLKAALETSIMKLGVNIERRNVFTVALSFTPFLLFMILVQNFMLIKNHIETWV